MSDAGEEARNLASRFTIIGSEQWHLLAQAITAHTDTLKAERDRARSHSYQFPNIHSEPGGCDTWWDGCCCFEEEMIRLKIRLKAAVEQARHALETFFTIQNAQDIEQWKAKTRALLAARTSAADDKGT